MEQKKLRLRAMVFQGIALVFLVLHVVGAVTFLGYLANFPIPRSAFAAYKTYVDIYFLSCLSPLVFFFLYVVYRIIRGFPAKNMGQLMHIEAYAAPAWARWYLNVIGLCCIGYFIYTHFILPMHDIGEFFLLAGAALMYFAYAMLFYCNRLPLPAEDEGG